MKIGDKIEGTIVKITIGRDENTYVTIEFDDLTSATVRERKY